MIPTCGLSANQCRAHAWGGPAICSECGAPISWHRGGSLDVYGDRDVKRVQSWVHDGFFDEAGPEPWDKWDREHPEQDK